MKEHVNLDPNIVSAARKSRDNLLDNISEFMPLRQDRIFLSYRQIQESEWMYTEKRIFAENSLKVIDGANFMSNIFKTANARGLFGVALLNSRLLYFYSRKME